MSRGAWLSAEQVADIKAEIARGLTRTAIAQSRGIHRTVVSYIALGKRKTNGLKCVCERRWCRICSDRAAQERYRERKRRARIA